MTQVAEQSNASEATSRSPTSRLAEFGRKEIRLAEHEMPGLMALRREYGVAAAVARRADHRLAAHDDPDGGADRDARRARCRGALGVVQHLLDAGPRRGRGRRRPGRDARGAARRAGLRLEGRDAGGVLVVHGAGADVAGRRRRTCCSTTAATPRCSCTRASSSSARARCRIRRRPTRRSSGSCSAARSASLADDPPRWTRIAERDPGRDRGDDDRCAPALPDGGGTGRCCSRRSTSTTR